jgi:hypothetical protein
MKPNLDQHSDPNKTIRHTLPYSFRMRPDGTKLAITNLRGQVLMVSRAEVSNILAKDDLDPHRRRMYEAALEEFKKAEKEKMVQ